MSGFKGLQMSRYAILTVGSHQYQVQENTIFEVEKLPLTGDGKEVKLDQVLVLKNDDKVQFGQPFISKASVTCEVLDEVRLPKIISFKFKRRKGYKRKKGHRQTVLRLKVKSIQSE